MSRPLVLGPNASGSLCEIVDAHYGELRAFARQKAGNPVVAEDLVQEAFARLAGLGETRVENPRALLYRIIGNLAIDRGRREARERTRALPLDAAEFAADEEPDAERGLIARQRLASLKEAVDALPARCRECFILRRFEDVDPDEIARRMGISRNMVEKHLRHAVTQCALALRSSDH
ncbi:ECF sigma factor [Terrihabitans soli]|uniref:ECF sigma factor n=1 Tax=Terrihabitans soli TaxID=708113 RepID=A0A6S6QTH4_9HYPH|nr:sigma-70 family RNA polymerase sigma factor [Terrihabitans soli]BCJ90572.1 ECF sigma factor [Terrihabitans soli]